MSQMPETITKGLTQYTRSDIAQSELARVKAENERLRNALEWYGEKVNIAQKMTIDSTWARARLNEDAGKVARAALSGGEE